MLPHYNPTTHALLRRTTILLQSTTHHPSHSIMLHFLLSFITNFQLLVPQFHYNPVQATFHWLFITNQKLPTIHSQRLIQDP